MRKNNFKKYFQKINVKKAVLLVMILGIFAFSFYSLFRINRMNFLIKKECDERFYTEWTKEEIIELSKVQEEALKKEMKVNKQKMPQCFDLSTEQKYANLFQYQTWDEFNKSVECNLISDRINEIEESLKNGYEKKIVPDEERKATSRQEVDDYQECLKNQKEAIKERPEAYKFLVIVDLVILAIGLLVLKFY